MDLTWLGQFHNIIHLASQGWLSYQLPDFSNLMNQPFKSTFWINLCNQSSHSIVGIIGLWYIAFYDKYTYVGGCTLIYWGMYDSGD